MKTGPLVMSFWVQFPQNYEHFLSDFTNLYIYIHVYIKYDKK